MSEDFTYYSEINKVDFYILGSEENYIDSAVNVTNKELFKGEIPVSNGLYDPNMGTTEYRIKCSYCLKIKASDPGHFGSIDLSYPVKNPLFRDNILRWLKVVCFKCGRLLVKKIPDVEDQKVLVELVKLAKNVEVCPHEDCGELHPIVSRDKFEQAKFTVEYKGMRKKEELFNHEIRDILARVTNDTVLQVRRPLKSHPKNLMLDIIRVPPNTIRPDIRRQGGARSNNNDVTAILKKIVEINEFLPPEVPEPHEITKELREMYFNLDMAYYEMVKGTSMSGNQVRMVTTSGSNKAPSSIASRINKKTGRIRKNLMGKRTRMMLRSVITGDNSLHVDEIGLPLNLARSIQIPETVREYNIEKLNVYFKNKRDVYPGCSGIQMKITGKFHRIEHIDVNYTLQIGDVVYRDIIAGDYIGFNRQPSLLFGNIGSHRVVIMEKGSTIKISVSACAP